MVYISRCDITHKLLYILIAGTRDSLTIISKIAIIIIASYGCFCFKVEYTAYHKLRLAAMVNTSGVS